jgi:glucose/arabinose dehydrogenase
MARRPRRPAAALFGRQTLSRAALLLALAPAAGAVTAPPGFTAAPIISGLQQPTAIAFAPDGRLFVLEKAGAVWTWTPGAGLSTAPILQVPSCTASEMGLTGIAVDPDFASDGFLYLYHAEPPGGDVGRCDEGSAAGRRNQVLRVTVSGDTIDPTSRVVLLDGMRTDNGNHDGGCLRVGPDGFLYVGVGDTGRGDGGAPRAGDESLRARPRQPRRKGPAHHPRRPSCAR